MVVLSFVSRRISQTQLFTHGLMEGQQTKKGDRRPALLSVCAYSSLFLPDSPQTYWYEEVSCHRLDFSCINQDSSNQSKGPRVEVDNGNLPHEGGVLDQLQGSRFLGDGCMILSVFS